MDTSLILFSTFTGCVSVSTFASLVIIPTGVASSVVGLTISVMTAGNKTYKSINKKKDDKIVLSTKNKLNNVEVLISEDLINTYIS